MLLPARTLVVLPALLALLALFFPEPLPAGAQEAPVSPGDPRTVSQVVILTRYESPPPETYRELVPIREGQAVTRAQVESARKMLEQTGIFRSVKVEEEALPDGRVRLIVHLWQLEKVREVAIKGNLYVLNSAIYRVLEMQVDDTFNPEALPDELERIRGLYRRKGWFGADVTCSRRDDPANGSVSLTYRIQRGKLLYFKRIDLEGVQAGDPEVLRGIFRLWPVLTGGRLKRHTRKAVKYYQELGYPAVKIDVEPDPFPGDGGSPRLAVRVQEGKKLEVSLEGNASLSGSRIRKALTFDKEGGTGFFDAEDSARAVRALYQKKGYPLATVRFRREEAENRVDVAFTIDEGPRAFVDRIVFAGGPTLPERRLRKQMLTRPRNLLLLRRGVFLSEKWSQDLESLEGLFLSKGFMDVRIREEIEKESGKPHRISLRVDVEEGSRYTVGDVHWEGGVDPESQDGVDRQKRLKPGDDFNPIFQSREARRVARYLAGQGFLLARVETSHEVGADRKVDLRYRVRQGPRFLAAGIVVTGNEETRTRTVRKAVRLSPGDPIRNGELVGARDRLFKLRLFEGLSVTVPGLSLQEDLPEGMEAREVMRPVLIKVKEQKSLEMEIGGRYDSDTGFEGFVSLQENNLFHRAQRLYVDALVGEIKWEAALSYTVPTLLDYRVTGTLVGRHKQELYEAFTKEETLGTATLLHVFRDVLTPSFSFTAKDSHVFDVLSVGPGAPRPSASTNFFFSPDVQLDTRDDKIYPTRGFFLKAGVAVSGRDWGSTDNLVFTDFRVSGYHSFRPGWTLAVTGSTDFVEPYGDTREVPSTELLFAGGNESVRGFPRQRLGPVDIFGTPLGGTTRVLGSAEFRFPIYRLLHGYVFVDVGSLTNGWDEVAWRTFRWTSGGGVRLYTPVGPLCLGYGYQLQDNPPLDRGQIIFSLGFPY